MIAPRQYTVIARSYAEALFRAARAQGILQRVQEECKALAAVVDQAERRLRIFMGNPKVPTENKLALIDKALAPRFSPLTVRMLHMLVRRERTEHLGEILALFVEMGEQAEGIHQAQLQSAVDLSFQDRLRLKAALEAWTGCRLKIEYEVDSGLIGGLVFRFRDTLIDSSLRAGLALLRRRMLNTSLAQG